MRRLMPTATKEQEAFWALAWLDENYGIASTTAAAGFNSFGGLISQAHNAFLVEVKHLYHQYKRGELTKGAYARKLGPFEKLIFKDQTVCEAIRITRSERDQPYFLIILFARQSSEFSGGCLKRPLNRSLILARFYINDLLLTPLTGLAKVTIMASTHPILADVSAGISELKKNPMSVMKQGDGAPVAILNRNEPVFYAVPAKAYEELMDKLEDIELAAVVRARLDQPEIEVSLDEL